MKIISYGHVKPKETVCSTCGAQYEYVPRDIDVWRPGTKQAKAYVRCPVCGNITWVDVMLVKHANYTTFKEE